VLDLIRSRKLAPNAEITNLLLAAFDKLREMVNDPGRSEKADTQAFLDGPHRPGPVDATATNPALIGTIVSATGTELPVIVQDDHRRDPQGGLPGKLESRYVYELQLDLFADVEKHGRTLNEFIQDLRNAGEIVDCNVDGDSSGSSGIAGRRKLPTKITFSSRSKIDPTAAPFFLSSNQIKLVSGPAEGEPRLQRPNPPPEVTPPQAPVPLTSSQSCRGAAAPSPRPRAADPTSVCPAGKDKEGVPPPRAPCGSASSLLESLMNLAGELVLSRNQLRAVLNQHKLRGVQASFQRINLVTSELQDAIMQTRMQPIGNVFAKFPRVVRDMARLLKKDIQLDIRGKDVGLDKSLIEGLSDPLTHMVRNAADHGIESVEERLRAGKRATGTLRIEARHEAGQVVVEIADDGKGLDPTRSRRPRFGADSSRPRPCKAMSDQEKMHLIFLPGLSTAEKVTDVSGRGVGMDVVKTNLARLGGKVDIVSEIGQGTLFRIKLPLTLAIIPSLVVSVNDERFAIPQISVVELLRIRADKVKERIEVIGDAEVLVLRDELIPIVRFADILGIKRYPSIRHGRKQRRSPRAAGRPADHEQTLEGGAARRCHRKRRQMTDRRQRASSDLEIVVVNTGAMKYGLVVDYFHTGEEIVVKPLGRHLKGLPEYAGATIMGDGTVALIVDAAGLAAKAQLANVAASAREAECGKHHRQAGRESLVLAFLQRPRRAVRHPARKRGAGGKGDAQAGREHRRQAHHAVPRDLPAPGHALGCGARGQHRRRARTGGHRGQDSGSARSACWRPCPWM
jgi:two-component system chemotaxis sensor kinase CheA